MECRTVRDLADWFVSDELTADERGEVLAHLPTCGVCRMDIETRQRVRRRLREAFERSPALQPSEEFRGALRRQFAAAAGETRSTREPRWRWLAIAASVALVAGLAALLVVYRWAGLSDALVVAAVGDHRNCALKFRLEETPISLDEAARRYGAPYAALERVPGDRTTTGHGEAQVLERHLCVFAGRRFAHLVLRYQGRVVSVVVARDDRPDQSQGRLRREGRIDAMQTISLRSGRYVIVMAGDVPEDALMDLSGAVAPAIAQRLAWPAAR